MSVHEDSAVDLGDLSVVVPGISKQISRVTNIAKSETLEPAKCDDRESIARINEVDVVEIQGASAPQGIHGDHLAHWGLTVACDRLFTATRPKLSRGT